MLLLDTNVISELMRPAPNQRVLDWLRGQPLASLVTTAVSVMEIRSGLARLPRGLRRAGLEARFEELLRSSFDNRILPFDNAAAEQAASVRFERSAIGRPIATEDAMIAGIGRCRNATIVTRDDGGFAHAGVSVVDPWTDEDQQ